MSNTGAVFDHIGLWCTDLKETAQRFSGMLGVEAHEGGRHDGQGTWNKLVGAGAGQYLELIAVDPEQTARGTIARRSALLADLSPCLLAYRSRDLERIADIAREEGCETPGPFEMQRAGSDGKSLVWRVLFFTHAQHELLPFFIDWQDTPHPSTSLGDGVEIHDISMASPQPTALAGLLECLGLSIHIRHGAAPRLHCILEGPAGSYEL